MVNVSAKAMAEVRRATESFAKQYCRTEERLFPLVWQAFSEWMSRLKGQKPEAGGSDALRVHVQAGLGFAHEDVMDLVTPRVLAATYAAVFDATTMPGVPPTGAHLRKIVAGYGKRFRVPDCFLPVLEELLALLVRDDFEKTGAFPVWDVAHDRLVLIRWDHPMKTAARNELQNELEGVRSLRTNLDLFLDDLSNEFLVKGDARCLASLQRLLLVELLTRVGDYWEYADLIGKIWGDELYEANDLHQLLLRLHEATDNLLKPFLSLPAGLERCYVSKKICDKVKYVVIVVSGAY